MRKSIGAGAALFVCIVAGCSQASPDRAGSLGSSESSEPVGSVRQGIQNGTLDSGHKYAVGVCGKNGGGAGNCQSFCSGALILPNLVVTARHCVDASPKQIPCDVDPPIQFGGRKFANYWITTDGSMLQASAGWHHVKQILVPTNPIFCGNDIALLVLDDLVAETEARPITPNVQYSMSDPKFARSFTAIGYGDTAPNGGDVGLRRMRKGIPVLCIPEDPDMPCHKSVPTNEFVGGTGTCGGDSGSSAYEQSSWDTANGNANPVSFGVLSRGGESDDGTACQRSVYTRLDKWRDLVLQAADVASANWTLYPKPKPDWTGPFIAPPVKADGGADGGSTATRLPNGEACTDNTQCESSLCAGAEGSKVCSQACVEADVPSSCPDGFTCKADVCVANGAGGGGSGAGPKSTTTTEGCSVAGGAGVGARAGTGTGTGTGTGGVALGLVGVGLVLGARRRRGR